MGRRSNIPVGATVNGWLITEKTSYPNTSNQRVSLKCVTCNTVKLSWSSNIKQDKVRCSNCYIPGRKINHLANLLSLKPVLAFHGTHIELYVEDEALPEHVPLFSMTSERVFAPFARNIAGAIPEPDRGYAAYLKVPKEFADYLRGEADIDDGDTKDRADAFYAANVEQPTAYMSPLAIGSGQVWYQDDVQYTYLYWRDTKSWPKDQPPKPKPPKTEAPTPTKPIEPTKPVEPTKPIEPTKPEEAEDLVLKECDRIRALPVNQRTFELEQYLAVETRKRSAAKAELERAKLKAEWAAEDEALKRRKGL